MNERELKRRFWKAVCSGSIKGRPAFNMPSVGNTTQLHVVEEAEYRAFDLLIAAVETSADSQMQPADPRATYASHRSNLYYHIALKKHCRIDRLRLFPIELKSDEDVLDERLARQIANALYAFGNSTVVLDEKHSKNVLKSPLLKALPCTFIAYSGSNGFEVISQPNLDSRFQQRLINRRKLALLLADHSPGLSGSKISKRLELIDLILNKVSFNEQFFSSSLLGLSKDETEFLASVMGCPVPQKRRRTEALVRETSNRKLSDYMDTPSVDRL